MYAFAAPSEATCVAQGFLGKINDAVLFPLIMLMMAIAFVYFLYGSFQFVVGADEPAARETGRKHMVYGIIGLLVMISAAGILAIAANTFGLDSSAANCAKEVNVNYST
jgi:hypothetical protein